MRKLIVFLLALLCLSAPALAEDVCTVDAARDSSAVTDRSYLRVTCPIDSEAPVTMTILDQWGYLFYQRDYGTQSGSFCSEDVYLRLDGETARYTVTLAVGGTEHTVRVTRELPLLTDTAVHAHGLTMEELCGGSARKMAVILDVDAMKEAPLIVPMLSEGVQLGEVIFTVENGELTVSAQLYALGEIDKATVYVARDAVTARSLGTNRFAGRKEKLNRPIDVSETPYAAVLVQLTVSYDPATAYAWQADGEYLLQQQDLWQLMQLMTANEALG